MKDPFQDYYFATLPSLFPFGMPLQREREKFQGQNREREQRHYFSGKVRTLATDADLNIHSQSTAKTKEKETGLTSPRIVAQMEVDSVRVEMVGRFYHVVPSEHLGRGARLLGLFLRAGILRLVVELGQTLQDTSSVIKGLPFPVNSVRFDYLQLPRSFDLLRFGRRSLEEST